MILYTSHIQAIPIQKEVINADYENSFFGIPRCRTILYYDNFLKGIVDSEKREGFLLHFCLVRNRKGRLDIVSFGAFVANKIYLQLLTDYFTLLHSY